MSPCHNLELPRKRVSIEDLFRLGWPGIILIIHWYEEILAYCGWYHSLGTGGGLQSVWGAAWLIQDRGNLHKRASRQDGSQGIFVSLCSWPWMWCGQLWLPYKDDLQFSRVPNTPFLPQHGLVSGCCSRTTEMKLEYCVIFSLSHCDWVFALLCHWKEYRDLSKQTNPAGSPIALGRKA